MWGLYAAVGGGVKGGVPVERGREGEERNREEEGGKRRRGRIGMGSRVTRNKS